MSMRRSCVRWSLVAVLGLAAPAAWAVQPDVASGDVTISSAVLWVRADVAGSVTVQIDTDAAFPNPQALLGVIANPLAPMKVKASGLLPGTRYFYRAKDSQGTLSLSGTFRTPSAPSEFAGFRMGVSGDWRGELSPYPSVKNAPARNLDLFVALGDTIYADVSSPAVPKPQCETITDFRLKHKEVYSERFGLNTLSDLRRSAPILAQIDDHEVTNDFAGGAPPASDPRFAGQPGSYINETPLFQTALQAFHEYNPIEGEFYGATGDPRTAGKIKLYRQRFYGRDAAVFSLDARSFRDTELPPADPLNQGSVIQFLISAFNPTRTMLGNAQLAEVKAGLLAAQQAGTTWKFVLVPEPIQNLGVLAAEDRFEGYAAERTQLLAFINAAGIKNVVFVSADIHGTLVNNLTYQLAPFGAQVPTGAFDISTGSVAYAAPFGPTVAAIAAQLNLPGSLPLQVYLSLPASQQEAYITALINAQIAPLGYDPLGLDGAPVNAELLVGSWTATNSFGWTEFNVNEASQALTVTTYGIPWYDEATLLANPGAIAALNPKVIQQFVVHPTDGPCYANCDNDSTLTISDFLCFQTRFALGEPGADCDGDLVLSISDFICFQTYFALGC